MCDLLLEKTVHSRWKNDFAVGCSILESTKFFVRYSEIMVLCRPVHKLSLQSKLV